MQETKVQSHVRPHAREQLSLCTPTIEPVLQSAGTETIKPSCHNKRSHTRRNPLTTTKEQPLLSATEKSPRSN